MTSRERSICDAYRHGLSLRACGERFGLTHEGVRQVLLRCGVALRRPGGRA